MPSLKKTRWFQSMEDHSSLESLHAAGNELTSSSNSQFIRVGLSHGAWVSNLGWGKQRMDGTAHRSIASYYWAIEIEIIYNGIDRLVL